MVMVMDVDETMDTHVDVNKEENSKRKPKITVLDNFAKLTNGQEVIRTKAGLNLVKYWGEAGSSENGKNEINYGLGRLIRGLGSSKVQARYGFYSTLTSLLAVKHDITVDQILEHVEKQLKKSGSNAKSENADICLGHILLCCSAVRSNLFVRSTEEDKKKILDLLIPAGKERSYLKLVAYNVVNELIERLVEKEFVKFVFPSIKDELSKPWPEQTMDNLYLMMMIQNKYEGVLKTKFLKRFLGSPAIICEESVKHVVDILMSLPKIENLKHPVYGLIAKTMANNELLQSFMDAVDSHVHRPNRNKFLTTTKLISEILDHLENPGLVPLLLTDNYIKQILGSFRSVQGKHKDNELVQTVHRLFNKLIEKLKPSEISHKVKIAVLKKLLFYPGTFIFEKITRSKVIQHITLDLNADGVKKLAKVYREVVLAEKSKKNDESSTDHWINNDRLYAAHLFVKLVNHSTMNKENDWKVEQLKFLMYLGLFKDQEATNVGYELAASLKDTFFRALDMKHSKLEDVRNILFSLIQDLEAYIDSHAELRNPLKPEEEDLWKKTILIIHKIHKKKSSNKSLNLVFHTLFLHMGLQLFNDSKLASDSLKELFVCYERTKGKSETEESDDPLWIEVVIDLFLNLLSHSSHLLRSVINSVFPHLCKHMNASTVYQILTVLDPKNENPLSNKGNESEDESNDEDDQDSEDKDDQDSDEKDEKDDGEEDLDDEDDEDDDDDEMDEDEDDNKDLTVNEKLKMALHQVFINNAKDDDQMSIDLDELSDTEGEKLNEALGQAFKQFKPNLGRNKKKQTKTDEALTHFRVRVLDLVKIYLDSEPPMDLALEIMLPLLETVEFSIRDHHQKPLEQRLKACLKQLSGLRKFSSFEGVDETVLQNLLQNLLNKGTKTYMLVQEICNEISGCCNFIIRCSQILINNEETPKKTKKHLRKGIRGIIENALNDYFRQRSCVIPYGLFKNLIQLDWDGNVHLIPSLTNFSFDDQLRPFRKTQALELIRLFMLKCKKSIEVNVLEETLKDLFQKTMDLLKTLSENISEHKAKDNYITNLFLVWTSIKHSPFNTLYFEWKELGEAVREFRSNVTFSSDARSAYHKLCGCLGVSNVVKMKQKPLKLNNQDNDNKDSVGDSNEKDGKRIKQKLKRKNPDKLKLKKEAKEKRYQTLSEGLGNETIFSNGLEKVLAEDMEIESQVDESETNCEQSKKKRKNEDKSEKSVKVKKTRKN